MCIRDRYGWYTKLTEMSGTGIDVVQNIPKCPVLVSMLYRTHRSVRYGHEILYLYRQYRYPCHTEITVRYRCGCRTERTEVSAIGTDVPILHESPVPVLMSDRYRYWHRYRLGRIYRRCMYRTYPVCHGGTRLGSSFFVWYAVQKVPFGLSTEKKKRKERRVSLNLKKYKYLTF